MKKEKILDGISVILGLALVILLVVFRKDYDALLYSASILGILLGICLILKKCPFLKIFYPFLYFCLRLDKI